MTSEVIVAHFSLPVFETVFLNQVHYSTLQMLSMYNGHRKILDKSFCQIILSLTISVSHLFLSII